MTEPAREVRIAWYVAAILILCAVFVSGVEGGALGGGL